MRIATPSPRTDGIRTLSFRLSVRSMLAIAAAAVVVAQPLPAQRLRVLPDAGRMVREMMLEADTAGVVSAEQRWRPLVRQDRALTALLDGTIARLRFQSEEAAGQYAAAQSDSLGRTGARARTP